MHLTENSQPVWVDFMPTVDHSTKQEAEQNSTFQLKSGVISDDWETKETWIFTWMFCFANHGRPPGANVAAIADAATVRPEVIFTLSVVRGGRRENISIYDIVVGDVIPLKIGVQVTGVGINTEWGLLMNWSL
ncbi:unnamed protein product [Camellia sinensis]